MNLMSHFNVDMVVHGSTEVFPNDLGEDPYTVPKDLKKFEIKLSGSEMNTGDIISRIIANRSVLARKIKQLVNTELGNDSRTEITLKK